MGDAAPTEGEALQLLAQLHEQGLLHHEGSEALEPILKRRRRRTRREVRSSLGALLFVRVPLFDPDRIFEQLAPLTSPFVSLFGALLWCALIAAGVWSLLGEGDRLARAGSSVLETANLPALAITIILIKLAHESGHALILKALARRAGGARVPKIGVLMLLFFPFPYIDVSGAWVLRSKWHRALVGAGGMLVELGIAGLAAVVWARASPGTPVSTIAFNALLSASVSTILFNANPLLRYDGYHILCDLLEQPNLASRASGQLRSVLKRVLLGLRHTQPPARDRSEGAMLVLYALASGVYRMLVFAFIGLFIMDQQFVLGGVLLLIAAFELVAMPVFRLVGFLATSDELASRRSRAVLVSVGLLLGALLPTMAVPLPAYARLTGVVEHAEATPLFAKEPGDVAFAAPKRAVRSGEALVVLTRPELAVERRRLSLEAERLESLRRVALRDRPEDAAVLGERLVVVRERLAFVSERLEALHVSSPHDGEWRPESRLASSGGHVGVGDPLGTVARTDALRVRAPVLQDRTGDIERAPRVRARTSDGAVEADAEFLRLIREDRSEDTTLYAEYRLIDDEALRPGELVHIRALVGRSTLGERVVDALRRVFDQRGGA
ncbi:MAG: hypothetical protein Tsb0013_09610 [Phycisphaerales bacterium]